MLDRDPSVTLQSLLQTMAKLRAPDGCPWDAEQTPQSLAPYILEEACELVDALESGDEKLIRDELGDLLLQVVFQAQIFAERGRFDFADVAHTINAKLIRRHPHVFEATTLPDDRAGLDRQWDRIKRSERPTPTAERLADHLPTHLPALQRAQKLVSKLFRAGRQAEFQAAMLELGSRSTGKPAAPAAPAERQSAPADEIARQLMELVATAQAQGVDAEGALRSLVRGLAEELSALPQTRDGEPAASPSSTVERGGTKQKP